MKEIALLFLGIMAAMLCNIVLHNYLERKKEQRKERLKKILDFDQKKFDDLNEKKFKGL